MDVCAGQGPGPVPVRRDAIPTSRNCNPMRSGAEADAVLGETLDDTSPLANEIDLDFHFLSAVVSAHARR